MAFTDFKNGVTFTVLSATPATFTLLGGRYAVAVNATWGGGSATLQVQMPDGSTYVTILTAFTVDGAAIVDLPAATYKMTVATATALQGFVIPVPYRPAV